MVKLIPFWLSLMLITTAATAVEIEDHDGMLMNHGDGHLMDMGGGMVMGQNTETLPPGCDKVSDTKEITVRAGHKYAEKFPGRMFAFDTQEFNFKPCTKLTVHFINEDRIRHQWMMHGLPKNIYNKGMFHLEVSGPAKVSGTLILPPTDKTYLVHCDIAQHMEKGMKAQLKVGKGDGDLPSIPGVTANANPDDYKATLPELLTQAENAAKIVAAQPVAGPAVATAPAPTTATPAAKVPVDDAVFSGVTVIGLAIGFLVAPFLAKKFKGMTVSEAVAYSFEMVAELFKKVIKLISSLINSVFSSKNKVLPGS